MLITQLLIKLFVDSDNNCDLKSSDYEKNNCKGIDSAYNTMMIVHGIILIFDFCVVYS